MEHVLKWVWFFIEAKSESGWELISSRFSVFLSG